MASKSYGSCSGISYNSFQYTFKNFWIWYTLIVYNFRILQTNEQFVFGSTNYNSSTHLYYPHNHHHKKKKLHIIKNFISKQGSVFPFLSKHIGPMIIYTKFDQNRIRFSEMITTNTAATERWHRTKKDRFSSLEPLAHVS